MKFQNAKFARVVGTVCAASVASSLCLPAASKAATSNTAMLPSIYSLLLNSKDKPNAKTPNFITIVLDDMGYSDFQYLGGEIPTPKINDLAENGIKLTRFYAAPVSTPSRAMLFTGKDNHQVGIGNMRRFYPEQEGQPGYEGYLNFDSTPFPELLQKNGYYTMMTGKWDLGGDEPEDGITDLTSLFPVNRGFDTTRSLLIPGGDTHYSNRSGVDMAGNAVEPGTMMTSRLSNGEPLTVIPLYTENGESQVDGKLDIVTIQEVTGQDENGDNIYASREVPKFPRDFYSTDYYTDMAVEMLDDRDKSKPFYLNVSYIAPHTPLQVPEELRNKYESVYAKGWDVLLQERFDRMIDQGWLPEGTEVPPRPDDVPAWDSLTEVEKATEARRMAIYAGMIEKLDDNIGRLVQHLKDIGEYENTVIFVMSDNGGEKAAAALGIPPRRAYIEANFDQSYENMGNWNSYVGMSRGWSRVENAPFNRYKASTYEGGIHTAAFVHYPQSKTNGTTYDCITSIRDIAPTILEMARITYPADAKPLQGISMENVFASLPTCTDRSMGWEIDGTKGFVKGNLKFSMDWGEGEVYHYFDLSEDIFEREELPGSDSRVTELVNAYEEYTNENGVFDVQNPDFSQSASQNITLESVSEMSRMMSAAEMEKFLSSEDTPEKEE